MVVVPARSVRVFMLVLLFALAGCAGSRRLPPPRLGGAPGAPAAADSLALAAFLDLDGDARAARRAAAVPILARVADRARYMEQASDPLRFTANAQPLLRDLREYGVAVSNSIRDLEEALRLDPADVRAWCEKARLETMAGDWASARRDLDRAEEALAAVPAAGRRPLALEIATRRGWLCRALGRWDEGLQALDRTARGGRLTQDAQLVRGLLLAGAGRFSEACRAAARLEPIEYDRIMYRMEGLSKSRSIFGSRWIEAMAFLAAGRTELAFHALGELNPHRLKVPYQSEYWNDVGLICELGGRDEEARLYYALSIVTDRTRMFLPTGGYTTTPKILGQPHARLPVWTSYGRYYYRGSLFTYASQMAAELLTADDPEGMRALADHAREVLTTCMRRDIRPTLALALRGRVSYAADDLAAAETDLLAAHGLLEAEGRRDAMTCLLLGMLRLGRDQYAAALPYVEQCVAADSTLAAGWRALGVTRIQLGDRPGGRAALDRALELRPFSVVGLYNRALLNCEEGRMAEGIRDLSLASQLAPDNGPVQVLLGRARAWAEGQGLSLVEPDLDLLAVSEEDTARAGVTDEARAVLLARRVAPARLEPVPGEPDAAFFRERIPALETAFAADPSAANREALARAYVRTWQPERGLDLLLAVPPADRTPGEERLVLEADRALGFTERALAAAQTALEGTPLGEDPEYWSLVAFTLLDNGLRTEGFAALGVAIEQDLDHGARIDADTGAHVGESQEQRHTQLNALYELHKAEIQMRRQADVAGGGGATKAGGE